MLVRIFHVLFVLIAAHQIAGKLVKEQVTLTWEVGAPNGQPRELIKLNGQFPGPTFVWDEDDDIELIVHNQMPFNTSIHWHGLLMQGTPWSDGAPGVTQKPIESDQSYVYRFKAYPPGTQWYHSHSRMTLQDGLYGAIYIRPKPSAPAPWSLISSDEQDHKDMNNAARDPNVLLVSDWTRFKSWEYMAAQEASRLSIFCVDSILLNGKGKVYCPGEDFLVNVTSTYMKYALYPSHVNDKGCFPFLRSTEGFYLEEGIEEVIPPHMQQGCIPADGGQTVFEVDAEAGWASFNFVAAFGMKSIIFSIDEHPMWVYEADGHYIGPQLVDTVMIWPGERYAVMIKLDMEPKDYVIRVADAGLTQIISSFATMRYRGGHDRSESRGIINYGGRNVTKAVELDRDHLPPFPPIKPAASGDVLHVFKTHRWYSPWKYTMSGEGMYTEDRSAYAPLLYDPYSADAMNESLVIRTQAGQWVDVVFQVGSFPGQPQEFPHMIHKHANKMWQIGAGVGLWNYSSVAEAMEAEPDQFNLENPMYRDTFITSFDGASWIALRYQVTNPGPWLFHCHLDTHLAGGMAVVILDAVEDWPAIPSEYGPDGRGFASGPYVSTSPAGPEIAGADTSHSISSEALAEADARINGSGPADDWHTRFAARWDALLRQLIGFLETLRTSTAVEGQEMSR